MDELPWGHAVAGGVEFVLFGGIDEVGVALFEGERGVVLLRGAADVTPLVVDEGEGKSEGLVFFLEDGIVFGAPELGPDGEDFGGVVFGAEFVEEAAESLRREEQPSEEVTVLGGPLAVADCFGGQLIEDAEKKNAGFDFVVAESFSELGGGEVGDEAGGVFAEAVAQEIVAVGEELLAEDVLLGEGWDGDRRERLDEK